MHICPSQIVLGRMSVSEQRDRNPPFCYRAHGCSGAAVVTLLVDAAAHHLFNLDRCLQQATMSIWQRLGLRLGEQCSNVGCRLQSAYWQCCAACIPSGIVFVPSAPFHTVPFMIHQRCSSRERSGDCVGFQGGELGLTSRCAGMHVLQGWVPSPVWRLAICRREIVTP